MATTVLQKTPLADVPTVRHRGLGRRPASALTQLPAASTFDVLQVVADLRKSFNAGRTRPLSWRRQQLQQIVRMVEEQREAFSQACWKDIHKSSEELYLTELLMVKNDALEAIASMRWRPRPLLYFVAAAHPATHALSLLIARARPG